MKNFSIKTLTRDSIVVGFEGGEYNVNGERGLYVWDIYPEMVYFKGLDEKWRLLEDASLRAQIVEALLRHWIEYEFPWELHVVED